MKFFNISLIFLQNLGSQTNTMKIVLVLLLATFMVVDCLPHRHNDNGRGMGKARPCDGEDNIELCECQDGSTYDNKDDLKENCSRHSENDILFCKCLDGETWTPPKKRGKPGRGKGKEHGKGPKGPKPCGGENNLEECECQDGSNHDNKNDLMKNCGHRSNNDIVSCTCKDGETWTLPKKPERPCIEKGNIQSCTCEDGETYESKKDLKENCKDDVNPIETCECKDGTIWEPASDEEEGKEEEEEYEGNYEDEESDEEED